MKKNSDQSGQMLVSALILLVILFVFLLFIFFVAESYIRNYSNMNIARNEILKENTEISNILNELSINNYLIVQSLSVAQKAFLQASELSLYHSFSQPYWKTHSTLETSKIEESFDHYLSAETKRNIQQSYLELQSKSARGLVFSKSLVQRNKFLLNKLPQKIAQYFIFSSNSASFCLGLKNIEKQMNYPGFFYFPLLENFYSFYFKHEQCKVLHKRKNFIEFINKIDFLSYATEDTFYVLENLNIISRNIDYGILYIPYKNAKNFLNDLFALAPKMVNYKNNYSVFYRYINRIFGDSFIAESNLFKYSKNIYSRIIHPNLNCKWEWGDNLEVIIAHQEYFDKNCTVKENDFLFSFFLPHWVAVINFEKDILNYANDK